MSEEITQLEYDTEIERIAREALTTEREYRQNAQDAAWKIINEHPWVIYTENAVHIPVLSYSLGGGILDNADLNARYKDGGLSAILSLMAFACMLDDVQAQIDALREDEEEDEEKE